MALFHLSVTQTKRSAGQSAIASAAYRAGERLYSEYYGEYSDYTRKGGVICSDILLPSHSGASEIIAEAMINFFGGLAQSQFGMCAVLMPICTVLSNFTSNNATV